MTNPEPPRRGRQFEIDRLCAEYADAVEAGRGPDPKVFLAAHPDYQVELSTYIVTYHLLLADLPQPDETPEPARSPAFDRALAAIHASEAAQSTGAAGLASLAERSFDVGIDPESLAERVGVSSSFIARLDAHAIAAATIPATLFRRLASALDVQVEAVRTLLTTPDAGGQPGGAFYYADQQPATAQDDFLTAIEASDDLDEERKAEWRALVARGDVE